MTEALFLSVFQCPDHASAPFNKPLTQTRILRLYPSRRATTPKTHGIMVFLKDVTFCVFVGCFLTPVIVLACVQCTLRFFFWPTWLLACIWAQMPQKQSQFGGALLLQMWCRWRRIQMNNLYLPLYLWRSFRLFDWVFMSRCLSFGLIYWRLSDGCKV